MSREIPKNFGEICMSKHRAAPRSRGVGNIECGQPYWSAGNGVHALGGQLVPYFPPLVIYWGTTAIVSAALGQVDLLALPPTAASAPNAPLLPTQIGSVEISPLDIWIDTLKIQTTNVNGSFVRMAFGLYKSKFAEGPPVIGPGNPLQPAGIDPLLPQDVCRDRFWLKGPVYVTAWTPPQTGISVPLNIPLKWRIPRMTLSEGEGLTLAYSVECADQILIFSLLRYKWNQRRLQ
jgi:hypothetical protein